MSTPVQSAAGNTGASNASACTVATSATGSGNLLVAFVDVQGTATVTITPPAGWLQVGTTQGYASGNGRVAMFYLPNSTSGVTSFAFAFSTPVNASVAFEEWPGILTTSPLDTFVVLLNPKQANALTGTTGALAGSGELAIWGLAVGGATTLTYSAVTNGYTEDTASSAHSTQATEAQATLFYNSNVGPGATSSGCTMSGTGATGNTTILAIFKPSGSMGALSAQLVGVSAFSGGLAGDTAVVTVTTGSNPYAEIMSQGSAGTTGAAAIPAVPTSHGWVYAPGAGTLSAGTWQASVNVSAAGWSGSSSTTTLTLRAFRYSGGIYTPIGTWAPVGVTGTPKTLYSFPPTSFGAVVFGASDLIYLDLWWGDASANGVGGDNPAVYVSSSGVGVAGDMQIGLPLFTPAVPPPPPPPPGAALSLVVGGQPMSLVGGSLSAKSMIGRRGELSATVYDPAGARLLQQYEQVALYDVQAALAFTGYITQPQITKPGFGPLLLTQFTATDQHYLADKRVVAQVYRNQTVEFMVGDLVANWLSQEGVTIGQITPTGVTVPVANFGYVTASSMLDALVTAASGAGIPYYWSIDKNKALWFVPYATLTGPTVDGTTMDDGKLSGTVPTLTPGNPKYRNTQYAVGGTQQTGVNDETRAGDGQTRSFTYSYALNAAPTTFTLNGAAVSLGVKGQTGYQYYYAVGDPVIAQDSSQAILASTDRLRMVYVGQVPGVFTAQNTAQVAALAALDGTSGIVEAVLTDTTITSAAQGQAEVGQQLTQYCVPGAAQFTFATRDASYQEGQAVTVNFPPFGFSGAQMLVTIVELTDQQDGTMIWYVITAVKGPYDTTWAEFFGNILKPPQYDIAANIALGITLPSPLYPSTSLYPSPTLFPGS